MKKELLSPVGNLECLYSAIHNGCDAIYLGGKKFGARAFADNFTEEELIHAIKYCHLYGVKIYVTVNTMLYEPEIEDCISYIRFLHQNNVDALIMQDIGLIKRVREQFPNLEIHASTQMHTHNLEQLKLLESLGVKRVVLARELSLEEIKNLKTNMEIEVFIHGALCISYSGQCLFSSLLLNRSGNRGSCAGICRLPFKLVEEGNTLPLNEEYLLSPKELATFDNFNDLMDSNITSFKIEGRMKSPSYVAYTTRLYRRLIDAFEQKKPATITEEEKDKLKVLFNRGFTKGHLFHETNNDLMNGKSPNHQGIFLGHVIETTSEKIKIQLDRDLHQEDGIRFVNAQKGFIVNYLYDEKGKLINSAKKGSIVFVANKIDLRKTDTVVKTIDSIWEKELKNIKEKKIFVTGKVIAKKNNPLKLSFFDGENKIEVEEGTLTLASNIPTTKEIIKEKLSTLGNSPFVLETLDIELDENIFIPMSLLKSVKHKVVDALIQKREEKVPHPFKEVQQEPKKEYASVPTNNKNIHVLVRDEEQLKTCLKYDVASIYVTDALLYKKYKQEEKVYLRLPRVKNNFTDLEEERLLVGESGSLYKYGQDNTCITDTYFNVANHYSFSYLESLGAKRVTLSIENSKEQIEILVKNIEHKEKIELYIYGKPEVMVMKYCPINRYLNQEDSCTMCQKEKHYYLKDRNEKLYRLLPEAKENHINHLFYYETFNNLKDIPYYQSLGIENYHLEFLEETPTEIESILCKISKRKI